MFFQYSFVVSLCDSDKLSLPSLPSVARYEERGSSPEVSLAGNLDN